MKRFKNQIIALKKSKPIKFEKVQKSNYSFNALLEMLWNIKEIFVSFYNQFFFLIISVQSVVYFLYIALEQCSAVIMSDDIFISFSILVFACREQSVLISSTIINLLKLIENYVPCTALLRIKQELAFY